MQVKLTVIAGPHAGRVFTFAGHDTFLVGRSKKAHFQLASKDRYFSRIHFMVEVNPPHCRLTDLDSHNGTYVNGQRVTTADLHDGDHIKAGHTILRIAVEEIPEAILLPEPEPAARPTPRPVPAATVDQRDLEPGGALAGAAAACRTCGSLLVALPPAPAPLLCPGCEEQARTQPQPVPGYRIVRELGRGGMGVVYLALRAADGVALALKTIKPMGMPTRTAVARFLREANILRELAHLHIVRFYEMGEVDELLYFAMEHVRGTDAQALLRSGGPFTVERVVTVGCQLLDALEYAHGLGFVHRDIKPSNLLVTEEAGRELVRLTDFGLARVYQSSALSGLTLAGEVGGTVAFMAPEQITSFREAKPAADQYAAAATLYNLLTGCHIYDLPGRYEQQLLMILNDEPVPLQKRRADVPQELAAVIHRALAREPEKRFPDVRLMRQALLQLLY
jgi:serine/threonine-protein kinase